MTDTVHLTMFLRARLAEDEALMTGSTFCAPVWPTVDQMLADVEGKRRILDSFTRFVGHARAEREHETTILKALALPYASHPDYNPHWALPAST